MSAKEMFEELGYEIDEENDKEILYKMKREISTSYYVGFDLDHDKEILYKMKWEISTSYYVGFDLDHKNFECFITSDSPFEPAKSFAIDLDLLQAINQQCRELGWLDE